jgi:hypothetical protein
MPQSVPEKTAPSVLQVPIAQVQTASSDASNDANNVSVCSFLTPAGGQSDKFLKDILEV